MNLEVPELVRQRAQANGEAGREWLGDLPRRPGDGDGDGDESLAFLQVAQRCR